MRLPVFGSFQEEVTCASQEQNEKNGDELQGFQHEPQFLGGFPAFPATNNDDFRPMQFL